MEGKKEKEHDLRCSIRTYFLRKKFLTLTCESDTGNCSASEAPEENPLLQGPPEAVRGKEEMS